jgi:hypothetical protein
MVNEMPKHDPDTKQIDIDFEGEELDKIAEKYKILDKTKIFKDPKGIWRFYKTYQTVEEWDKERSSLDEKEKNDTYHQN